MAVERPPLPGILLPSTKDVGTGWMHGETHFSGLKGYGALTMMCVVVEGPALNSTRCNASEYVEPRPRDLP